MDIFGDAFGESPAPQNLVSSGESGLPVTNLDDIGGLVSTEAPVLASPGEGGSLFDAPGDASSGGDLFSSNTTDQASGSESLATENKALFGGTEAKEDALTNSLADSFADPAQDFIEKEKQDLADIGLEMGMGSINEQASVPSIVTEDLPDAGPKTVDPEQGTAIKNPDESDDGLDYDSNFNFPSKPRMTNGEEPQVIVEWRRSQAERIRVKDEEEEMRMKEMRERAKKDLEDYYRRYNEEVNQRKEENKVLEKAFLEEVNGLKPGTEWERVAKNCGFNSKVVHCKKDRSRLRNVILSLKQNALLNRE